MFEHQKPAKLFTLSIKPRQLICYNCIKVNIIAIPVVYPPPRSYKANGVFKPDSWVFLHCWDIVKSLLIAKLVTQPTHPLVLEKIFFGQLNLWLCIQLQHILYMPSPGIFGSFALWDFQTFLREMCADDNETWMHITKRQYHLSKTFLQKALITHCKMSHSK